MTFQRPWTDAWIGLPYRLGGRGPEAYDCFGLYLALVRFRSGRVVDDPNPGRATPRRAFSALLPSFHAVSDPIEGDALVFRAYPSRLHVGYALDNTSMLHIEKEAVGSVIDRFTSPRWASKLQGVYRLNA